MDINHAAETAAITKNFEDVGELWALSTSSSKIRS